MNQKFEVVKKGDNLKGKTLKITLYGTSQDSNILFSLTCDSIAPWDSVDKAAHMFA